MSVHCGIICPFCFADSSIQVNDDFDTNPYPIYCPECGECVNEEELENEE